MSLVECFQEMDLFLYQLHSNLRVNGLYLLRNFQLSRVAMKKFQQSAPFSSQTLDPVRLEARSKTVRNVQENFLFSRTGLAFKGVVGQ